jgi:hypothetical protein
MQAAAKAKAGPRNRERASRTTSWWRRQSDTTPSYLEGSAAWAAIGDQAMTSATVEGTASGTTWYVRVQAMRATALGKMVGGATAPC